MVVSREGALEIEVEGQMKEGRMSALWKMLVEKESVKVGLSEVC